MDIETIKWLANQGLGAVIGVIAIWQIAQLRRDLASMPDWFAVIHSRLTSLDADTLPPPPEGRRKKLQRLRTAPTGWPTKPKGDP